MYRITAEFLSICMFSIATHSGLHGQKLLTCVLVWGVYFLSAACKQTSLVLMLGKYASQNTHSFGQEDQVGSNMHAYCVSVSVCFIQSIYNSCRRPVQFFWFKKWLCNSNSYCMGYQILTLCSAHGNYSQGLPEAAKMSYLCSMETR